MPESLPGAPAAVSAALLRLKDDLTAAAGPNFVGLILYGGLARGRYRPGKSDVNVLVLLKDASAGALAAIAPALKAAWRSAAVEPMLLTPAEVAPAALAFPTKFLDIKDHHIVLAGADPFPGLDVPRETLRVRIEQELRNLLLRLRHGFLAANGDAASMAKALTKAARPFALELAPLLKLAGKEAPTEDRSAAIFAAAAAAFGLPGEALKLLAELRQNSRLPADVPALFRDVLASVAQAIAVADRLKEARP